MKTNKIIFTGLLTLVIALVFYITKESFSGAGLSRFEGKLEEMDFYRNENNTGPVLRVYSVKVIEKDYELMQEFAKSMPHTKYGRTLVFFFSDELNKKVKVRPNEPYFDSVYEPFLMGSFQKTPMGEERFSFSKND
ncbi:MAG: hypothetical protein ACQEW9_12505 [Bacteroidota bacterium]